MFFQFGMVSFDLVGFIILLVKLARGKMKIIRLLLIFGLVVKFYFPVDLACAQMDQDKKLLIENLVSELSASVIEMNIKKGIQNGLDAELNSAIKVLNENNDVVALNSLNAFITAVTAQKCGQISCEDGAMLLLQAQKIKYILSPLPIRLKSWKNDYLRRQETSENEHSLITWGDGLETVDAEWIFEYIDSDHIRLKSWKGDYLMRTMGSSEWNKISVDLDQTARTKWKIEIIEENKIMLKSVANDYLHRKDTLSVTAGVTVWPYDGIENYWEIEYIEQ